MESDADRSGSDYFCCGLLFRRGFDTRGDELRQQEIGKRTAGTVQIWAVLPGGLPAAEGEKRK